MTGHDAVIAARLAGKAPVALTFFVATGKPNRLGHVHVTEAEAMSRQLDLRFAFAVPCAVNGFLGSERAAQALYDCLTKFSPARVVLAGPNCLREWTREDGEIEWEA